jgi:hypothetical protein
MLNSVREAGAHHVLSRQQRQDREQNAAPREDPELCRNETCAHRFTLSAVGHLASWLPPPRTEA